VFVSVDAGITLVMYAVLYNTEVSAGSVNVGWSSVVVWILGVVKPSKDVVYVSRWLLTSVWVRFRVRVG
jgi:hypothetical protein